MAPKPFTLTTKTGSLSILGGEETKVIIQASAAITEIC